jgi:cation:H+ antiporter
MAYLGYRMNRRKDSILEINRGLILPYLFITVLFPATLIPAVFGGAFSRYFLAIIFLAAYFGYVVLMIRNRGSEIMEGSDEPYFHHIVKNSVLGGLVQLVVASLLLYYASSLLVQSVSAVASAIGVGALALSIIIIPAATAIPETASALIWTWRGKDTLGIGALVGEKILFATFYPGIGLLITAWSLNIYAYISVLTTVLVSLVLLYYIARQKIPWSVLLIGFAFFIAYAVFVFLPVIR